MELSEQQIKELHIVFKNTFHSRVELQRIMSIRLGVNINVITGSQSLDSIIFDLINWAEAQGQLAELIRAVAEEKPQNAELQKLAERLLKELEDYNPSLQSQGGMPVIAETSSTAQGLPMVPIEYPLREAISLYKRRLLVFVRVLIVSMLFFGAIFLLLLSESLPAKLASFIFILIYISLLPYHIETHSHAPTATSPRQKERSNVRVYRMSAILWSVTITSNDDGSSYSFRFTLSALKNIQSIVLQIALLYRGMSDAIRSVLQTFETK
jgi:hypothetical protein